MQDQTEELCLRLRRGEIAWLNLLLDSGAAVNGRTAKGLTPLMRAAVGGNVEALGLLLDWGAEVDAACPDGLTALMRAASYGHTEAVRLLIERGADVNARALDGTTALMHTFSVGDPIGAASQLIEAGVDVNAEAWDGSTAVDWAMYRNNPEPLLTLLNQSIRSPQPKHDPTIVDPGLRTIPAPETLLSGGESPRPRTDGSRRWRL